jgi:hypothetical protein
VTQSRKESVPVGAIKRAKAERKPIVEPACSEENDDVTAFFNALTKTIDLA